MVNKRFESHFKKALGLSDSSIEADPDLTRGLYEALDNFENKTKRGFHADGRPRTIRCPGIPDDAKVSRFFQFSTRQLTPCAGWIQEGIFQH